MLESHEIFRILEIINSHSGKQFFSLFVFCFWYGDIKENKEVFITRFLI